MGGLIMFHINQSSSTTNMYALKVLTLLFGLVLATAASAFNQQDKLLPDPEGIGGPYSYMGSSVSQFGDRILVGGTRMSNQGAAIVFRLEQGVWIREAVLIPDDLGVESDYGFSVSLSDTRAVIGAPYHDINGEADRGAVYVYQRQGEQWTLETKLTASDGVAEDYFGYAVSTDDDRVLVGAYGEDDNGGNFAGAAYLFEHANGAWTETKIVPQNPDPGISFGKSVSLDGDRSLIGAPAKSAGAGAVFVFDYNNGTQTWNQSRMFQAQPRNNGAQFGRSVSLEGNRALVGEWHRVDPVHDGGTAATGAAYVFEQDNAGDWIQQAKLTNTHQSNQDFRGFSVSLSGNLAAVGAYGYDTESVTNKGAVTLYAFDGNTWQEEALVLGQYSASDFGWSVSLQGQRLTVSAPKENSSNGLKAGNVEVIEPLNGSNNWSDRTSLNAGGAAGNFFGSSVALFDGQLAIGSSGKKVLNFRGAGSISIRTFSDGRWLPIQNLAAPNPDTQKRLGQRIVMNNDHLVTSTLDKQLEIFKKNGSQWQHFQTITPDNSQNASSTWGLSLALSGGWLAVGDSGIQKVHLYRLTPGSWSYQQTLTSTSADFGQALALQTTELLIGAPGDNTSKGAVFLATYDGNTWQLDNNAIRPPDPLSGAHFGASLALDDRRMVVGAPRYGKDKAGNSRNFHGSAYVFNKTAGIWIFNQHLFPSDAQATYLYYGNKVDISDTYIVVGTDFTNAGNQTENYVDTFTYDSGAKDWLIEDTLTANPRHLAGTYGTDIALDGTQLAVTDAYDGTRGRYAGAVYVYGDRYQVGGTISGLVANNTFTVAQQSVDYTLFSNNGAYHMPSALLNGADYNVTVAVQPTQPKQTCVVSNPVGSINGADVTDVDIECTTDQFTIRADVNGLADGKSVSMTLFSGNSTIQSVTRNNNDPFAFSPDLDDGSPYRIEITNQPNGQTCASTPASGTLNGEDVTVTISCSTDVVTSDISITKVNPERTYRAGSPITYTITASNLGQQAINGLTVNDVLPNALTQASWTCQGSNSGSCTASGTGNIQDAAVSLPAGASVVYTLRAQVADGTTGILENTAFIDLPNGTSDPVMGNNQVTSQSQPASRDVVIFVSGFEDGE